MAVGRNPFHDHIYGLALADLQEQVLQMGGQVIAPPDRTNDRPMEILRELRYAPIEEARYVQQRLHMTTQDQHHVYEHVSEKIDNNTDGVIFIDAPGGTGKTFLLNILFATVRSAGKIALATASSGIAATLLTGGRTAHCTFKISLELKSSGKPTCINTRNSNTASLLREARLIVWNEAPMVHKLAFALDLTLRDILDCNRPFGGKLTVLCGDFRQILPVVHQGTRADIVNVPLKNSTPWKENKVKIFHLTANMRVRLHGEKIRDHKISESYIKAVFIIQDSDANVYLSNFCLTRKAITKNQ